MCENMTVKILSILFTCCQDPAYRGILTYLQLFGGGSVLSHMALCLWAERGFILKKCILWSDLRSLLSQLIPHQLIQSCISRSRSRMKCHISEHRKSAAKIKTC